MKPDNPDKAYLWDMLQAADEARALCRGFTFETIEGDRRTLLALERLMELIGEAARRVSDEFQRTHPEIAWRKIIGLFLAATKDTATLSRILKAILPDHGKSKR